MCCFFQVIDKSWVLSGAAGTGADSCMENQNCTGQLYILCHNAFPIIAFKEIFVTTSYGSHYYFVGQNKRNIFPCIYGKEALCLKFAG